MFNEFDIILENGDKLFKSLNMFRILGVDDLPAKVVFMIVQLTLFLPI